ncbi:MAG: retroviral-like aspartic protease family protein [Saprospiraceae bacterium]
MPSKFLIPIAIYLLVGQLDLIFGQTTIAMKKEGGVFTIPCTVNGLKLKFIFDTGASDVSISLTEALFMLKNDYLNNSEILGSSFAQLANGEITENTKIILRNIEFGGLKINNVKASVVHELAAPLLLGQTAMAKLGKFQLDPNTGLLTILNGPNNSINTTTNIVYNPPNKSNYSYMQPKYTTLNKTMTTIGIVHLHKGPSPLFEIINEVPYGTVVKVIGLNNDGTYEYYEVMYNGQHGYINKLNLEIN